MNRFILKSSEFSFIIPGFCSCSYYKIGSGWCSHGVFSVVIGSVDDFAVGDSPGNYSGQYKDLAKLVKNINREILSKFGGSSRSPSSVGPTRYLTYLRFK